MNRFKLMTWLTAIALICAPASATTDERWSLDRQGNGIDIYTRPVPGSGIKEFKGISEFDRDLKSILAVLRDSDRFKDWFPNTPESKLLSREGKTSHQYSVMDAPWPVSDRDYVFRVVTTHDETTGSVELAISADPTYYPEQKGRIRVQTAKGSWKLEPISTQKTRVTFRMHLEPGGGIPEWLINARVVDTPFEALTNLRATVGR
jgi:hypothetical protein